MSSSNLNPSLDSRNNAIPLINLSRSPSPYPTRQRNSSNTASETEEDDDWGDQYTLERPFLSQGGTRLRGWDRFVHGGGFGQWLFTTNRGWQFFVAVLVIWLGGCQIGLMIMNRIILWSAYLKDNYTQHTKLIALIAGVYKFPYPLTTTLFEMIITHLFVLLSAYITRWCAPWLTNAGVSGMVAPSGPWPASGPGFRGRESGASTGWANRFSGIAGGGFFEFEWSVAKHVLPAALVFVAKVTQSNLSFSYAQVQIYVLARIGIVPISLVLTAVLAQQVHSVSTMSSAITATLTLLAAISTTNTRAPWEAVVTGVLSSLFVALYPIQLLRSYKKVLASLVPQGEIITNTNPNFRVNANLPPDHSGSREEVRAYWRVLHYTSILSLMIMLPIPFLTGEVTNIYRNAYTLDVFFHWLMVLCGGCGSWAVFWATLALTRATSPLTTTFLFIPRAAFLLPIMAGFKMAPHSWIGIGMCWASCAWFWISKMKEGRMFGGLR